MPQHSCGLVHNHCKCSGWGLMNKHEMATGPNITLWYGTGQCCLPQPFMAMTNVPSPSSSLCASERTTRPYTSRCSAHVVSPRAADSLPGSGASLQNTPPITPCTRAHGQHTISHNAAWDWCAGRSHQYSHMIIRLSYIYLAYSFTRKYPLHFFHCFRCVY